MRPSATVSALVAAVALHVTLSGIALAQDDPKPKPLTGDYYMGAAGDAEGNAPKDHVYITLTGDAAKEMFDAMPGKPVHDECVGRISKWGEGLVCHGAANDGSPVNPPYECELGIDLKKSRLEFGQDC
jgi:hypothetical protein